VKPYEPTEEQIQRVLSKTQDPRQLAIAYLKAQRRAVENETAFKLMDGVAQMAVGVASSDINQVEKGASKFNKTARTFKQQTEKDK
jgi:hypothetical protein